MMTTTITTTTTTARPSFATARVEELDESRWTSLSARFLDHNYRQTWAYGHVLAKRHRAVSRHVAIWRDRQLLGLADVRVKRLPLIGGGIAYISGGPLTRQQCESHDSGTFADCLSGLCEEFVRRQHLLLRVAAPLGDLAWNTQVEHVFRDAGFTQVENAGSYRTVLVDLRRPLPVIRAALAQKWRNCLNQAERNELEVVDGQESALFAEFERLFQSFVSRKRFDVALGADFFRQVQERSKGEESLRIAIAKHNGAPIAGILISSVGDSSVYILGATEEAALRTKAAYLLQWWAIRFAHERGFRWYDLGGIDPQENAGVYHFKSGLGGNEMTAAAPHEFGRGYRVRATKRLIRVYRQLGNRISPTSCKA